jgi:methyltransferase-like protein/2-polyprenyl-3-methyl-5-hydroxy-6-metoxy-1,4-benzoquinol methylase
MPGPSRNAHSAGTDPVAEVAHSAPTPYDAVSYPGHVYEHTHPNRLAALAKLYGMDPTPVAQCRVLELGCGSGSNLLPMAFQYPRSEFVGIDLSGLTVQRGMSNVRALGLNNIRLLHHDIMDVDASFGRFDYIIAHGVYSWVPPAVRNHIMNVFKHNLTADGVCYVSYNAHPYSHTRNLARDMMIYHTRHLTDTKHKTSQAIAIMKFLSDASDARSVHGAIMRDQYKRVSEMPEEVLFHDDLNEMARAFLLHELVDEAGRHGLQYLSDAEFSRRNLADYPDQVRATLERFPETEFVAREQYQDFIDGNGFRRSLLCHDNVRLRRTIDVTFVTRFYLLCGLHPVDPKYSLADKSPMQFQTQKGATLTVNEPLLKAAHLCLGEVWPDALSFEELLRKSQAILPGRKAAEEDAQMLMEAMYVLTSSGVAAFAAWPPAVTTEISSRPEVSALVRQQAQSGPIVTNQLHQAVRLEDEKVRRFVQLLDGTRSVEAIVLEMGRILESMPITADGNSAEAEDGSSVREEVERSLTVVSKLGLLVG